jgi:branched-chain amino acid transport system substrate-binding protein
METIGRGMAQYAVRHRGMTTLAVITPTTIDEMTMGEAFAAEAERLGAHVLAVEKFRPDETDFGPYINDIKEALIGPQPDSTFYITLDGDTLKPGETPVSFDGLFIPATEQQLFLILPQLNFYRVTTSYLGADEWNTAKVLKLGEKVLKDAVFYSSEAAMHHSMKYDELAASYDAKYAAEPNRLVAIGYDAINILADAYRAGRQAPEDLIEYLGSLKAYEGASGRITFGRNRTNLELPLFTLREDQVRPLIEQPQAEEPPETETPPDSVKVIEYDN